MHEGFFEAEVADHTATAAAEAASDAALYHGTLVWYALAVEMRRIWLQTSGGLYLDTSSANIVVDDVEHVTDGSTYSSMCRTRRP